MNPYRKRQLREPRRDVVTIAKVLSLPVALSLLRRPVVLPPVSYTDRRFYNPVRSTAPVPAFRRSATRLVAPMVARRGVAAKVFAAPRFAAPRSVMLCRRRQSRKEVIHAKGIAGSRVRRPRRNEWSAVPC